jgi:MerR family transcriptional regulator/heat shock protein HspR
MNFYQVYLRAMCALAESGPGDGLVGIGEAAGKLGVHPRTLMAYERIGLVTPARRSNRRLYSDNELSWLACAQVLNRRGGISLQGLSTLLRFVPCWAIRADLEAGESVACPAASHPSVRALERVHRAYGGSAPEPCRRCGVYRANRDRSRAALRAQDGAAVESSAS